MNKYLKLISKKTKCKCAMVIVMAFIGSMLASIWPVKLGTLYTDISNGTVNTLTKGLMAIVTFGVIYLSAECITILRRVMVDCLIATHEAELRENSVSKLLKMPVAYYEGSLSGEKTAQLNQGVAGLSQLIKIVCNDIFATVLTAVCTLVQVMINASKMMVSIMLVYLLFTIVVSIKQIKSQNGIREDIIKQKNILDGQICQSIGNLEMIRSMNAEDFERNRLHPSISKVASTEKKHHYYMGTFDIIKQGSKILFQILLLIVSIYFISQGKMPAGTVITVCLLYQQLVKPIDDVYRFMDETASSAVKTKVLTEMVDTGIDPIYFIDSKVVDSDESGICIENVTITNPSGDKTLAMYDKIDIPSKKVVALKGANGCGKTTLVRSLIRYYKNSKGNIKVFGKDIDEYSQSELTSVIYYSPQVSFFIAGTVRDNLTYGIHGIVSDEELVNALQKVKLFGNYEGVIALDPYVALDFEISEGAKELSGGMKQRLALARAFIRTPKLFIFDEITANLDSVATEYVLSNIEEYAKEIGAGIIYISHESEVVDRCDVIINLVNQAKDALKSAA